MPSLQLLIARASPEEAIRMDSADVLDRLQAMLRQESTTYRCADYLGKKKVFPSNVQVDETCRLKMCQWCYQVVDQCKLQRETVAVAMSYLDRYLSTASGRRVLCDVREYQLTAMTSLYTAIKLHEPLVLEPSLLVDISRGHYSLKEIENMEMKMLVALKWHVNGPTPLSFVRLFLSLLPNSVEPDVVNAIMGYSSFQTELAAAHYAFVDNRPSSIALAAIVNALERIDHVRLPTSIRGEYLLMLQHYSELKLNSVLHIKACLGILFRDALGEQVRDITHAPYTHTAIKQANVTSKSPASNPSSPVCVLRKGRVPQ